MLGPGRAEASLAATVGRGLEELHLGEEGRGGPHEDELGDPCTPLYQKGLLAVVVYEGDPNLTTVARVYEPRRVDEGDPMPHRQTATGKDEPRVAFGYGDGYPGPHQRPTTRRKLSLFDRPQIVTRIPRVRPYGHYRVGNEAAKRDV